jgi:anti-sigma factor RsiW
VHHHARQEPQYQLLSVRFHHIRTLLEILQLAIPLSNARENHLWLPRVFSNLPLPSLTANVL